MQVRARVPIFRIMGGIASMQVILPPGERLQTSGGRDEAAASV
jgi:hypothetical protein